MNVKRKLKRSSHRLDQMVPASNDTVTQSGFVINIHHLVSRWGNFWDLNEACFGLHMGEQCLVEPYICFTNEPRP